MCCREHAAGSQLKGTRSWTTGSLPAASPPACSPARRKKRHPAAQHQPTATAPSHHGRQGHQQHRCGAVGRGRHAGHDARVSRGWRRRGMRRVPCAVCRALHAVRAFWAASFCSALQRGTANHGRSLRSLPRSFYTRAWIQCGVSPPGLSAPRPRAGGGCRSRGLCHVLLLPLRSRRLAGSTTFLPLMRLPSELAAGAALSLSASLSVAVLVPASLPPPTGSVVRARCIVSSPCGTRQGQRSCTETSRTSTMLAKRLTTAATRQRVQAPPQGTVLPRPDVRAIFVLPGRGRGARARVRCGVPPTKIQLRAGKVLFARSVDRAQEQAAPHRVPRVPCVATRCGWCGWCCMKGAPWSNCWPLFLLTSPLVLHDLEQLLASVFADVSAPQKPRRRN